MHAGHFELVLGTFVDRKNHDPTTLHHNLEYSFIASRSHAMPGSTDRGRKPGGPSDVVMDGWEDIFQARQNEEWL